MYSLHAQKQMHDWSFIITASPTPTIKSSSQWLKAAGSWNNTEQVKIKNQNHDMRDGKKTRWLEEEKYTHRLGEREKKAGKSQSNIKKEERQKQKRKQKPGFYKIKGVNRREEEQEEVKETQHVTHTCVCESCFYFSQLKNISALEFFFPQNKS